MKKLILASILMLTTLTACQNETQNDDLTNNPKTENSSKLSARHEEGEPIEIDPEIQAQIDATMNGTNLYGKLICSVGVGSIKGHSCLELWGGIYEYSWTAIPSGSSGGDQLYQTNPETGGYFYHYSFFQNSGCSCGK